MITLILPGCGHPWPGESRGGLAERDAPVDPDHIETQTTILLERGKRRVPPARLASAEDHLVLAMREHAAGLYTDADENTLAASIAVGGIRHSYKGQKQSCPADICPELAEEIK